MVVSITKSLLGKPNVRTMLHCHGGSPLRIWFSVRHPTMPHVAEEYEDVYYSYNKVYAERTVLTRVDPGQLERERRLAWVFVCLFVCFGGYGVGLVSGFWHYGGLACFFFVFFFFL